MEWSGAKITGDPRRLDLPISVDDAVAVLEDPRMLYAVTAETQTLGEQLTGWPEESRSADHAIAMSFLTGYGGGGHFTGIVTSSLLMEFGDDAIGGRLEPDHGYPMTDPGTGMRFQVAYDVLAAPAPPEWMSADPCSSAELAGRCVRIEGERGPLFFVWKAADIPVDDEEWVWMISMRAEEVVAVRATMSVPDDQALAMRVAGWDTISRLLDGSEGESELGLECGWCDEEHLERLSSGDTPVPLLE